MAERKIQIDYGPVLDGPGKAKIDNVSGIAVGAGYLWTVADEGFSFERLQRDGDTFAKAATFDLAEFFTDYPPPGEDESDLEGLAFDGNRLWMTGSHALVRKKYDKRRTDKLLDGDRPDRETARTLLGFVEIAADGTPVANSGCHLPLDEAEDSLLAAIGRDWKELGRAVKRPAKENGLDIEGIAVTGQRVFLGLRGPVLGPYSIVLEIEVAVAGRSLEIVERDGLRCRPHLIDTGGLGIRDLLLHPSGLVVLAGPTLDMDGPFELYLTRAPLDGWTTEPGAAREARFLMEVPIPRQADAMGRLRGDRPEAITLLDDGLLVVSERKRPGEERSKTVLTADLLSVAGLT